MSLPQLCSRLSIAHTTNEVHLAISSLVVTSTCGGADLPDRSVQLFDVFFQEGERWVACNDLTLLPDVSRYIAGLVSYESFKAANGATITQSFFDRLTAECAKLETSAEAIDARAPLFIDRLNVPQVTARFESAVEERAEFAGQTLQTASATLAGSPRTTARGS